MKIRHALLPQDLAQIILLAEQQLRTDPDKGATFNPHAMYDYIQAQIASPAAYFCGVAEDDDGYLRGYLNMVITSSVYDPTRRYAREFGFLVDPELIGHGIGARLLDWAEREAQARGVCRIEVCALPEGSDPNKLCKKLKKYGYSEMETVFAKALTRS